MLLLTATQILNGVESSSFTARTLGDLEFERNSDGTIFYRMGNGVIIFKIFRDDRWFSMRCYMRRFHNLEAIHRSKYLPQELHFYTLLGRGSWVDIVVDEWVEGETLSSKIEEYVSFNDHQALASLADGFDRLAIDLLRCDWAHGDLTGENIIVTAEGELQLIDFDGMFIPQFAGCDSVEMGTPAFQSPFRGSKHFDKNIDDYSIALISVSLRALAIEPQIYRKFPFADGIIIDPAKVVKGETKDLDYIANIFKTRGLISLLRITEFIYTSGVYFSGLLEILATQQENNDSRNLYISIKNGFVGYVTEENHVAIPHIYDDGLEFKDATAKVKFKDTWINIDKNNRVVDK